ncbi:hypothetical protein JTF06_02920 [Desemzia sp. RIT804]|uniref:hypothetical protein n=1 Tax=Desemzia sp. RIT 804 TaxID=2810209 RepID=UPI0019513C61|nr:hypothetical protein [Desemzia sp. RIT 804]MBM6613846.1 hypothetical protein [Desemzia sp. RIT 804]
MSNRDQQMKQNKNSHISSSLYARVNTGQNASNKSDGVQMLHTGGSMNNPDERVDEHHSLLKTFLFYVMTGIFVAMYILLGLWIFQDYFYNEGLNEILPSLALLMISLVLGSLSSKGILKIFSKAN